MPGIFSIDNFLASQSQDIIYNKAAMTTVAQGFFSLFAQAGSPGAGTLAGTDTTSGVVPDDSLVGAFPINDFASGALGYITNAEFGNSVASRIRVFDLLWRAGAYNYNASQTLSGQPSFSSRLPTYNSSPDYKGTSIWAECVTAFTGNQTFTVTYTNQDGTAGRTTGAVGISAAPTVGRMWQLPLQAGDTGVRKIESVTGGTGSAGTANILVMRELVGARIATAGSSVYRGFDGTRMVQVFQNSCIYPIVAADSTSSGVVDILLSIRSL